MMSTSNDDGWGPPDPNDKPWDLRNPHSIHGKFETLIDRCTFVTWAVTMLSKQVPCLSIHRNHGIMARIAAFARYPARNSQHYPYVYGERFADYEGGGAGPPDLLRA